MSVRDTESATVSGLQTADLLAALGQLGLDRDELCRAAGVDRQALKRPDSRIPTAQFVAILTGAERLRPHPFIGMHAGERCEPRGPVAYLLMSHGHLADGLQSLARVAATAQDRTRLATAEFRGVTASRLRAVAKEVRTFFKQVKRARGLIGSDVADRLTELADGAAGHLAGLAAGL